MDSNTIYQSNLVKARSRNLVMKASIMGSKHIKNGTIKAKFVRTYNDIANKIVREYEQEKKDFNQALSELEEEIGNLADQSFTLAQKGAGVIAGLLLIKGGLTGLVETRGLTFPYHGWMLAHGVNNTIEGGEYFLTGNDNYVGPLKRWYEEYAKSKGCSAEYGDLVYNVVDLIFAVKGLTSKSEILKQHHSTLNKLSDSRKIILFKASSEDYLIALHSMGPLGFTIEGIVDYISVKSIANDIFNGNLECKIK